MGPVHNYVGHSLLLLSQVAHLQNKHEEADNLLEEATEIYRRTNRRFVYLSQGIKGRRLYEKGEWLLAKKNLQESAVGCEALYGPDSQLLGVACVDLAAILFDETVQCGFVDKNRSIDCSSSEDSSSNSAVVAPSQRDLAREYVGKARRIFDKCLPPNHPDFRVLDEMEQVMNRYSLEEAQIGEDQSKCQLPLFHITDHIAVSSLVVFLQSARFATKSNMMEKIELKVSLLVTFR